MFEKHLRDKIYPSGYQNWSVPTFPAGPSTINPRVTLHDEVDDGDLYRDGVTSPIEGLEVLERQPSLQVSGTIHTASDAWTPDSSVFAALKSVVPKVFAEVNIPRSFAISPNTQLFTLSLHRQILFSVANNFAGLSAFPIMDLMLLLQRETDQNLYQLIRSARTYSSRAIVQNLLKAAIEAGDARVIDVLIRENPRDIGVNEQYCSVEGSKYTLLERATMLRYEDVVKVLLEHEADANKTYSNGPYDEGGALRYAALAFTLDGSHPNLDRHPQLFQMLLKAGGDLSNKFLHYLIEIGQGEPVVLFMSVKAGKMSAEWSKLGIFCDAIGHLDDHTSMEIASIMHNYGADLNHHSEVRTYDDSWDGGYPRTVIDAGARCGNFRTVKFLLESGAFLTGNTLSCAVASGNQDLILLLLTRGADANSIGVSGNTPLAAAIRLEDAQVLKLVEDHDAFELQGEEHFTAALKAASEVENFQIIEHLIRLGGKISREGLGYALTAAIRTERDEFAKMLIDAGADVNVILRLGQAPYTIGPPLLEALNRRKETLVLSLLDADADPKYPHERSPMVLAAEWGNRSVIENLIFAGADVNDYDHTDNERPTALSVAVKRQDHDLFNYLLAFGADIPSDSTALEAAVENGDIDMAHFLLDQGADPDNPGALQKAILKDEKLVNLIFDRYRARYPKRRGTFGAHVLAKAIGAGNEHLIRLMLENGVDANKEVGLDFERATSFGHAIARQQDNFPGCLDLFLQNGCNPNEIVSTVRMNYQGRKIPLCITALLAAIGTQNMLTVELFIRYGADVNVHPRGRVKRTPLQRAAEVGSLDLVELLINHGANVNAPAAVRGGGTALQLAAIQGYIPIACKLLSLKADPNAPASKVNGRTALEGAAEHGRLDMVQVLLNAGAGSRPGDEAQVEKAIAFARGNAHIPICDLLESHLSSRQGSGLELLANNNDRDLPDFNLDDDPFSFIDFEGAG